MQGKANRMPRSIERERHSLQLRAQRGWRTVEPRIMFPIGDQLRFRLEPVFKVVSRSVAHLTRQPGCVSRDFLVRGRLVSLPFSSHKISSFERSCGPIRTDANSAHNRAHHESFGERIDEAE